MMNSTELELEKQKLVIAELQSRLAQANQAVAAAVAQNTVLESDLDSKVAEALIELHAQEEAEKKAKAEDEERQRATKVVARPTSYAAYSAMTLAQKVQIQRLYADGDVEAFVSGLIAKDKREAQAAGDAVIMTKIQSTQARFKG